MDDVLPDSVWGIFGYREIKLSFLACKHVLSPLSHLSCPLSFLRMPSMGISLLGLSKFDYGKVDLFVIICSLSNAGYSIGLLLRREQNERKVNEEILKVRAHVGIRRKCAPFSFSVTYVSLKDGRGVKWPSPHMLVLIPEILDVGTYGSFILVYSYLCSPQDTRLSFIIHLSHNAYISCPFPGCHQRGSFSLVTDFLYHPKAM